MRRPRTRSATFRARKIHRYLGLTIGVQFLLWTAGGLYFSWTNIDDVHGDHLLRVAPLVSADAPLASPATVLDSLRAHARVDSLAGIDLKTLLGRPIYRVRYLSVDAGRPVRHVQLADATTGTLRPAVTREEAIAIARTSFIARAPVTSVEYLTAATAGPHHEYRGQPLPAWAVHFAHGEGATAYVAAELGETTRVRNDRWRVFDFLWMLHTMDFEGRDDINNTLLRAFSIFGLVTVLSGFVLFALTSPPIRRWCARWQTD